MTAFSFKKTDRLLKRQDFLRLAEVGKKTGNRDFLVVSSPSVAHGTRFGITVTKKVGNAVQRNRLKRLTREYFRHNRHRMKEKLDINVIVKIQAADLSSHEFRRSLENILSKFYR